MAGYPPISVRQPQPFDLVDETIGVCGLATGFEGVIQARVRDGNGDMLVETPVNAGGTGVWGNFHADIFLGGIPTTPNGTLELYEVSQSGDGAELHKVVVPIVFGRVLIHPFHGFAQHTVVSGDTLSALAQQWYGDASQWPRIFEANRHQLSNPNLIFPGQVLRIPQ
jgi:nucleoid-associated protein YgaU